MDVFKGVIQHSQGYLRAAALFAAQQLGLFEALSAPMTDRELAQHLGVKQMRLQALVDVLVFYGVLARTEEKRLFLKERPDEAPPPVAAGWGCLAEVIRSDAPLGADASCEHFQRHLASVGAAPASELAARLAPLFTGAGAFLDAGGGIGTYTDALLRAFPEARATLIDRPEVILLAGEHLRAHGGRVRLLPGDLLDVDVEGPYQVVLLCNVLHLYGTEQCQKLLSRACAALAGGGELVVKDLLVEPDRSGPETGLLFSLNMALYTEAGRVHDPETLMTWLRGAGLGEVRREALAYSPDSVVLRGRKSPGP